ncbi:lysine--tRNA ligase [soil metagenome]
MNPELSDLQRVRFDKAEEIRSRGKLPYPARTNRTHSTHDAILALETSEADSSEPADISRFTVGGRITSIRDMGKTAFAHLEDGSGQIQLYVRKDVLGESEFEDFLRLVDLGDIIEATGAPFRTRTGEASLKIVTFSIVSKALNAPPEKWHGLQDVELRYRQRYADLIANSDVRDVFLSRSKMITAIRQYLDGLGYVEVETPVLQPLYGGAAARPFTTFHNALDQMFYLRIADELYLKRLIVGGFERVYEICKDFRNEGVDRNHSPEFTMLEFYEAFADYTVMMDRVQGLVTAAAIGAIGSPTFTNRSRTIDLLRPWDRRTLREAIESFSGIDYSEFPDAGSLLDAGRKAGADIESGTVWPRIIDELLKQFVRPNLVNPTFLIDYPVELSPLAKRKPDDPTHAERFQLYIAGAELANAFSELNDPVDQLQRFIEQQRDRDAGDDEAMPVDHDYVNALMYGMPPTGGVGIGIDRLAMVFTDQPSIRDVVLFPAMRRLEKPLCERSEDDQEQLSSPEMPTGQTTETMI